MFDIAGYVVKKRTVKEDHNNYGVWRLAQVVVKVRYDGKDHEMCFDCVSPIAEKVLGLKKGDRVKIKFLIEAKEYKEKYYTNLKILFLEIVRRKSKKKDQNQNNQTSLFEKNYTPKDVEGFGVKGNLPM